MSGPQGSGNHMWSKIFAQHPDVYGWRDLLVTYWIRHDQEPFAHCWKDPDLLKDFDWSVSDYYVTSISVPYMSNGEKTVPDIVKFATCARDLGLDVKIALLGRDRNILEYQQARVRGAHSYDTALEQYDRLADWNPAFLSYELLHLYGTSYLREISRLLEFPIDVDNPGLKEIVKEDTNIKYLKPASSHPTDDLAINSSRKWK